MSLCPHAQFEQSGSCVADHICLRNETDEWLIQQKGPVDSNQVIFLERSHLVECDLSHSRTRLFLMSSGVEIQFPDLSHRPSDDRFDFLFQSGGESHIRAPDFGKIDFAIYFVAYKKFVRFDEIYIFQHSFFCSRRVFRYFRPSRWPWDLGVFFQSHRRLP